MALLNVTIVGIALAAVHSRVWCMILSRLVSWSEGLRMLKLALL